MKLSEKTRKIFEYGLLEYHGIFPNVEAILEHLFMTNGNGYEWYKGELVDVCRSEELEYDREEVYSRNREELQAKVSEAKIRFEKDSDCVKDLNIKRLHRAELDLLKYDLTYSHLDALLDNFSINGDNLKNLSWYPPCEYADILRFESDITDEWLWLVSEFIDESLRVLHTINYYFYIDEKLKWASYLRKACIKVNKIRIKRGLEPIEYKCYCLSRKQAEKFHAEYRGK